MILDGNAALAGQTATALFFSIVFLQSSLDKIFNWKNNRDWLSGHFSKTFISKMMDPALAGLTVVELIAGIMSAYGVINLLTSGIPTFAYYGLLASMMALLMLLFGQRIAQDYDGARTIAIYFGVALIGLFFF